MRDNFWPSLWEQFYSFVTLLSLAATVPALMISALVVITWHKEFILFRSSKNPTSSQKLIGGIYRGFVGSFIDNLWWGFAWTFNYIGLEFWRDVFFAYGVFCNVIFRQGALIWAGWLHIDAENDSRETVEEVQRARRRTKRLVISSAIIGVLSVFALMLIKNSGGS